MLRMEREGVQTSKYLADIIGVSHQDCSEVYRAGAMAPDWYELDTSGQNRTTNDLEVYCEEGWTYILTRDSMTNHHREV